MTYYYGGDAPGFEAAYAYGGAPSFGGGGYYEKTKRRQAKVIKDERDEKAAEFERLLKVVTGQAEEKAKQATKTTAPTAEIKPPRMPDVRGVDSASLRLWMPDLLQKFRDTYRNTYAEELARRRTEDEEIEVLTLLL